MKDPYQVLGVSKTETRAAIKRAYRKLAKEHHPDANPDDTKVAERFKDISSAYNLLGDEKKRARFDRGEIDEHGNERAGPQFHRTDTWQGAGPGAPGFGGFSGFSGGFGNAEDLFSQLFTGRRGGRPRASAGRGADRTYKCDVSFLEAARGGKKRVVIGAGKTLDVNIPAGIVEGQTIRLKGQGDPGVGGRPPGEAFIEVHIVPHPFFQRNHDNIHVDLPVTLTEAVRGAKIKVPTIDGLVTMTVPKGSNSGNTLRLKGRGLKRGKSGARGDQFVRIIVKLPDTIDPEIEAFVSEWNAADYDVRDKIPKD